jgi:hypothetical protein
VGHPLVLSSRQRARVRKRSRQSRHQLHWRIRQENRQAAVRRRQRTSKARELGPTGNCDDDADQSHPPNRKAAAEKHAWPCLALGLKYHVNRCAGTRKSRCCLQVHQMACKHIDACVKARKKTELVWHRGRNRLRLCARCMARRCSVVSHLSFSASIREMHCLAETRVGELAFAAVRGRPGSRGP